MYFVLVSTVSLLVPLNGPNSYGKRNRSQLESEYSYLLLDTFLTPPFTFLLLSATGLNGFTVFLEILVYKTDDPETWFQCH